MIAGGIRVVEVTMTVPGAVDLLRTLKQEYGATLLLGSGTVTTAQEAEATNEAGAEFVVSPQPSHRSNLRNKKQRQALHPRRAHAHRSPDRLPRRSRLRKNLPCSAVGGAPYLKSLLAPFPFSQANPHRRRNAAHRRQLPRSRSQSPRRRQRPGQPLRHRRRQTRNHHRRRRSLPASIGKGAYRLDLYSIRYELA